MLGRPTARQRCTVTARCQRRSSANLRFHLSNTAVCSAARWAISGSTIGVAAVVFVWAGITRRSSVLRAVERIPSVVWVFMPVYKALAVQCLAAHSTDPPSPAAAGLRRGRGQTTEVRSQKSEVGLLEISHGNPAVAGLPYKYRMRRRVRGTSIADAATRRRGYNASLASSCVAGSAGDLSRSVSTSPDRRANFLFRDPDRIKRNDHATAHKLHLTHAVQAVDRVANRPMCHFRIRVVNIELRLLQRWSVFVFSFVISHNFPTKIRGPQLDWPGRSLLPKVVIRAMIDNPGSKM